VVGVYRWVDGQFQADGLGGGERSPAVELANEITVLDKFVRQVLEGSCVCFFGRVVFWGLESLGVDEGAYGCLRVFDCDEEDLGGIRESLVTDDLG